MEKLVDINGQIIKAKRFKTLGSAKNYMNKVKGRTIVFFKAHEYFISTE